MLRPRTSQSEALLRPPQHAERLRPAPLRCAAVTRRARWPAPLPWRSRKTPASPLTLDRRAVLPRSSDSARSASLLMLRGGLDRCSRGPGLEAWTRKWMRRSWAHANRQRERQRAKESVVRALRSKLTAPCFNALIQIFIYVLLYV